MCWYTQYSGGMCVVGAGTDDKECANLLFEIPALPRAPLQIESRMRTSESTHRLLLCSCLRGAKDAANNSRVVSLGTAVEGGSPLPLCAKGGASKQSPRKALLRPKCTSFSRRRIALRSGR